MASSLDLLEGLGDDDSIWVENLLNSRSIFRDKDKYEMEPNGFVGSIISMPAKVARNSYLRRAVSRGKIQFLSEADASKRQKSLILREDEDLSASRVMESLEKGASDAGSRYTKKGLSDDGTEQGSISAQKVWTKTTSDKGGSKVRRSDIKAKVIASDEVPDGPLEAVVTETVKEGEWQSDTGL